MNSKIILAAAITISASSNISYAQNSLGDLARALQGLSSAIQGGTPSDPTRAGAPPENAPVDKTFESKNISKNELSTQQDKQPQLTLKDNQEGFGFKKYTIGSAKSNFLTYNCKQLFQGQVGLFSVCDVKNSSDTMGGKPVNVDKLVFRDDLLAMVYVSHKFIPTNLGMTGIGLQIDEVSKPIHQKYGDLTEIRTSNDTAYESVTAICVNSCRHSIFLYNMPHEFYQVYGNINITQKKLSEFTAVFAYSGAFDDLLATTNKIKNNARDVEQKRRVGDL